MFGAFFDGIIFIFGFVEDILSWHNQAGVCFCARFFVPLTCTEDTGFAKLNYRLGGPLSAEVPLSANLSVVSVMDFGVAAARCVRRIMSERVVASMAFGPYPVVRSGARSFGG